MRQIKFRGKRPNSGKWITGSLIQLFGFSYIVNDEHKNADCSTEVLSDTVSQFTGLVDRNGKEIYENDIVSFPLKRKNFLVMWNDDLCVYQFSDGSLINSGDNYSAIIFVEGNAFDNPELLNKEQ